MEIYVDTGSRITIIKISTIKHVLDSIDRMYDEFKVKITDVDQSEWDNIMQEILYSDEFVKEYALADGIKFEQYDTILGAWHPIKVRHSKNLIKRGIIENEDDLFDPIKNPNMIDHLNYLVKEFKDYWHKQMAV